MNRQLITVLAAEDEETDAILLRIAWQRAEVPNPLIVVGDGQNAIDYLSGSGTSSDRALHPVPGLLLLDLKMPRKNGFDVLAWLAGRPEFKNLPAIILSSSSEESDVRSAKELGARNYLVKPHGFGEFSKIIETVRTKWLTVPFQRFGSAHSASI
jgi:CheY-like chemotaxis protein